MNLLQSLPADHLRGVLSGSLWRGGLWMSLLLLAACATVPTQEMSDARQSVQAAYDAGADKWARENLRSAEEYLRRAERELELRFYSRARHDAIVAKSEALKARNVALAIRAAQEAIESAQVSEEELAEAKSLLAEAMAAAERGRSTRALELANEAKKRALAVP